MPDSHHGSFYIPSLDGLRAVSIGLVLVSHAGFTIIPGGFGVNVFFFLSGYLITTLLRREFEASGTVSLRDFYWRRVWRIFPPMYTVLALSVLVSLAGLTLGTPTVEAVTFQALHLTNYAIVTDLINGMPFGTYVMWSLAIEEHFYLVFPVVALGLLRRWSLRTAALVLLGFCALVLAWRLVLVGALDASSDRIFYFTDTRIDAILFGCVMGLWRNPVSDPESNPPRNRMMVAAGLATVVIIVTIAIRDVFFRDTIRYTVQSMALAPIFRAAIVHPDVWPFRWLNVGWIRFLGVISYSIYLVHLVVILTFRNLTPDLPVPTLIVVSGVVSVAVAYVIYLLVERPSARMRRRYRSSQPGRIAEDRPKTPIG